MHQILIVVAFSVKEKKTKKKEKKKEKEKKTPKTQSYLAYICIFLYMISGVTRPRKLST